MQLSIRKLLTTCIICFFATNGTAKEMNNEPVQSVEAVEIYHASPDEPISTLEEDEGLRTVAHPPIDEIPPMPMPEILDEEILNQLAPSVDKGFTGVVYDAATGKENFLTLDRRTLASPTSHVQGGGYCGPKGCSAYDPLSALFPLSSTSDPITNMVALP
ncbi:MAG: hypothetical protein D3923_11425, partial [Candidatus Electrothrix sp. AR3]|nr:hypothetical protein [Candidatus Electrothrix sp. AR3]